MPDRIGDLLLRDGQIRLEDVDDGLRVSHERRTRLASALVSLGRISIDVAARALAAQQGVPAVLEKHLAGRDLALISLIPASVAWAHAALPIALQRSGALIVCVRDPSPEAQAQLEEVSGRSVVMAVTPEIALLQLIDEAYPQRASSEPGIPIEIDVQVETGPVARLAADALDLGNLQLVDLDDHGVEKDPDASSPHIRLPGQAQRITGSHAAIPARRTLALDPALVAMTSAEDHDDVIEALLAFLRHRFQAGVVFMVKDGLALAQAGFGVDVADGAITALALPLAQSPMLRTSHDRGAPYSGPPGESTPILERFFRVFGAAPERVCVAPIAIDGRVVHLVYAHGPRGATAEDAIVELATLATAAEEALVRILREARP